MCIYKYCKLKQSEPAQFRGRSRKLRKFGFSKQFTLCYCCYSRLITGGLWKIEFSECWTWKHSANSGPCIISHVLLTPRGADRFSAQTVCGGHSGRPSVWLWLLPRRGAQGYSQDDGLLGEGKHVNQCVVSGNKPVVWSSTLAIAVTAHRPWFTVCCG